MAPAAATYFVSSSTAGRRQLLQSEFSAVLFIEVLYEYRAAGYFAIHEFMVMRDHFHALLTPAAGTTLERAMQLIKGGFSFRYGKARGHRGVVWQRSYHDRRIRDCDECAAAREYIRQNPVKAGYVAAAEDYPYGSASGRYPLDDLPQRLKPVAVAAVTQG